ncbi:hypothetical protein BA177_16055 [Woeseia oceani]|uniref:Uncharacterized protein n=1 Tax=Woeseia oceani TaxID=1548547 RepID=A0A193LJ64_9GAMM|nr:hypothetical protein BA177_16055 [Woeseia oceani]
MTNLDKAGSQTCGFLKTKYCTEPVLRISSQSDRCYQPCKAPLARSHIRQPAQQAIFSPHAAQAAGTGTAELANSDVQRHERKRQSNPNDTDKFIRAAPCS